MKIKKTAIYFLSKGFAFSSLCILALDGKTPPCVSVHTLESGSKQASTIQVVVFRSVAMSDIKSKICLFCSFQKPNKTESNENAMFVERVCAKALPGTLICVTTSITIIKALIIDCAHVAKKRPFESFVNLAFPRKRLAIHVWVERVTLALQPFFLIESNMIRRDSKHLRTRVKFWWLILWNSLWTSRKNIFQLLPDRFAIVFHWYSGDDTH